MDRENITVVSRSGSIKVNRATYQHIFDNSIHCEHPTYLESISKGSISLSSFLQLCRNGNLAYSIFFGDKEVVRKLMNDENKRLYKGFGGKVNVAIRGRTINLNSIKLIIKDIKNKQAFIARYVKAPNNANVKYLASSKRSIEEQAQCVVDRLGIDMEHFRQLKNKRDALWYLIEKLESNNVFVSFEAMSNMPQSVRSYDGLTGIYVRDKKFPFFFVCSEGLSNSISIPGRKIFTLLYLTVCMFKGESKLVTFEKVVKDDGRDEIYEITEGILMPANLIPEQSDYTLEDLEKIAATLNATEMAILVRLHHLNFIDGDAYTELYGHLAKRYTLFKVAEKKKREATQRDFKVNPITSIVMYQGKAFLRILKSLYGTEKLRRREINRQLSYGKKAVDVQKVFEKI